MRISDWSSDVCSSDLLDRQIAHHHFHAALARAITGEMRERQLLMDGTDVDDAAGSAGVAQVPHKSLRDEERALQIDIEHEVVVGLGDIPEIGTPFDADIGRASCRARVCPYV